MDSRLLLHVHDADKFILTRTAKFINEIASKLTQNNLGVVECISKALETESTQINLLRGFQTCLDIT